MLTNSESSKSPRFYFNVGDRVECKFYGAGSVMRVIPGTQSDDGTEKISVHFDRGANVSFQRNGLFIDGHTNPEWDLQPANETPPMSARDWFIVGFMAGACFVAGAWSMFG